jgi:hypothetical protein
MNAADVMAVVAATERELSSSLGHLLELQATIRRSRATVQKSRELLARLRSLSDRDAMLPRELGKLLPETWPCGIAMPNGVSPPPCGAARVERRQLAERIVARLREIGLDCEVIGPEGAGSAH